MKNPTIPPLTTPQAAKYLGIKPGTLEVWRVQGKGPCFLKLGRAVRYQQADLDKFLKESRCVSTSELDRG